MSLFLRPYHPRTEKGGTATGVDVICTYHPDPMSPGLNREELYQELSQLTHGVTWLGTYTLDRDSLYVNGECLCCSWDLPAPCFSLPVLLNWGDSALHGTFGMSGDISHHTWSGTNDI